MKNDLFNTALSNTIFLSGKGESISRQLAVLSFMSRQLDEWAPILAEQRANILAGEMASSSPSRYL